MDKFPYQPLFNKILQMQKIKVVVLMGGKSAEHKISLATGREVVHHLNKEKYDVLSVVISPNGSRWKLESPDLSKGKIISPQGLKKQKPDIVFIALHGPFGEDGTIQGMLEEAGLTYTGSGVSASALGMNKIVFRRLMEDERVTSPKYLVLYKKDKKEKIWEKFEKLPLVVKPSNQGSSVGISIVRGKKDLQSALKLAFEYSDPIIIEEYIKGIEVSCGIIGNDKPLALPVAEIVTKNDFFDYEAKYSKGKSKEIIPARVSKEMTEKIQNLVIKVYKAVGAKGYSRVDMIIRRNIPYVLEINTLPGLTPISLLPKQAEAAGIPYPQLLDKIIELALEK